MVCTRGALPPASVWPSTLQTPLQRRWDVEKGTRPELDHFEPIPWEDALAMVAQNLLDVSRDDPSNAG
ncbi:MAG: hypothetical protein GWN18_06910, partial [Thermoplasmata archaeon]|nr:hypothetical protein [Thermoplasmata archaeon]NIS11811.1 hypothetical protein [Thermoplasmata archaeon]NIS19694.1 hypothetical protein [Thermoplasmata archaeon]NIT76877.1 hypothetical protein [Thermoplasmata archaeon]NIU48805.1 hypothetical protein [Thermoplasmata archaeon]